MRGPGACLAGFCFVVPRQKKKTEIPPPLEVAESVAPVSWLVRTTTAPRKAAPDRSSTNPVKAPVEAVWLRTWPENNTKRHCQQECRSFGDAVGRPHAKCCRSVVS